MLPSSLAQSPSQFFTHQGYSAAYTAKQVEANKYPHQEEPTPACMAIIADRYAEDVGRRWIAARHVAVGLVHACVLTFPLSPNQSSTTLSGSCLRCATESVWCLTKAIGDLSEAWLRRCRKKGLGNIN